MVFVADNGLTDLREQLVQQVGDGHVARLIRGCLASNDVQAGRHPNGFIKVVLDVTEPSGGRVELHHWDEGTPFGPIHTHRRPFGSVIVRGQLEHRVYDYSRTAGDAHDVYNCSHPSGPTGRYGFDYLGPQQLEIAEIEILAAGDSYSLPSNRFHDARPSPEGPTTTLVLEGWADYVGSLVVAPDPSALAERRYESLPQATVSAILRSALDGVAQGNDRDL